MKNISTFLILVLLAVLFSCNKPAVAPAANNSNESGQLKFSVNMKSAPAEVSYLKGVLSRAGYDSVKFDFMMQQDSAIANVENLIVGEWLLSVNAFDAQNSVIYSGATNITVIAGQTTPVYLLLNPTTGALQVVVTWGLQNDYALDFDGQDDLAIVEEPDSALRGLSSEVTMEGWIFVRSFPNTAPRIIDCSDNTTTPPLADRFLLTLYDVYDCVSINVNGYAVYSNPIPMQEWIHVAGTYNGQYLKIFVNGNLQDSAFVQTVIDVKDSSFYVGNNELKDRAFDGQISSLSIWNRALSGDEIEQIRSYGIGNANDGLISRWLFNEGAGQFTNDEFGANHLQLGTKLGVDAQDPGWVLVH